MQVEAKDIRLGNYVRVDNPKHHPTAKDKDLIVVGVQDWSKNTSVNLVHVDPKENLFIPCYSQKLEFVKPIEITDDWLIHLGFIKSSEELLYLPIPEINSEIHYEKHQYGNVITLQSSVGMFIPNDIKYVHQLQNLFFAITGSELKLNNKG